MTVQPRTPRGVPAAGEYSSNPQRDQAAPLADDGFDSFGEKRIPKEDLKPGDIVWSRDTGFVVSRVERGHISQMEMWSNPDNPQKSVAVYSDEGDFWSIRAGQAEVTVLRDHESFQDHVSAVEEARLDEDEDDS